MRPRCDVSALHPASPLADLSESADVHISRLRDERRVYGSAADVRHGRVLERLDAVRLQTIVEVAQTALAMTIGAECERHALSRDGHGVLVATRDVHDVLDERMLELLRKLLILTIAVAALAEA